MDKNQIEFSFRSFCKT